MADKDTGKVFFKMLTHDYIDSLHIKNEKQKTISFEPKDEYADKSFITQAFRFAGIIDTNIDCIVRCDEIRRIIRYAGKKDYAFHLLSEKHLVYERGNVKGYITAFRTKEESKRRYKLSGFIDMTCGDEEDRALIHFEKGYVQVTRIPSDSVSINNADFLNIVLEIAKEVDKKGMPVWYFYEGPVYWFHGTIMYQMKPQFIELPRELRL